MVQTTAARRIAVALAALLSLVIAVAFRGSWTSQSDAAKAAHFDDVGAFLYPFAPDGLIVLALVGAVVLRHKPWPRWYCLAVVAIFTATSYVINHLHGLGTFVMTEGPDAKLVEGPLEGWIVGLVAVQLVGAIAFGSHILMHVFRHLFPEALDGRAVADAAPEAAAGPGGTASEGDPAVPAQPEIDGYELAKMIYGVCLDEGVKLSRAKLSRYARISARQAGYVQTDVEEERREQADQPGPEVRRRVTEMREDALMSDGALARWNGNGTGPVGVPDEHRRRLRCRVLRAVRRARLR
ncbi:hypothetical protein [Thermocatellispora tengchongensis]|uniref:hypothetical protein n=1 Tax=Thermocatellispora tengchongensis TaxID=1073253 RepID=UPI00363356B2